MKTTTILVTLLMAFALQMAPTFAVAQETSIRYDIPGVASLPAAGSSNQLRGSIEYDDTTLVIEKFSFYVPLFSFISDYGSYNYIAAIGGASTFPYLSFESTKIEQDGKNLLMKGSLYYRGMYRPITIQAKRTEEKTEFYVSGNFMINIRDYYLFSGGLGIPSYMNIHFRMAFDKTTPEEE
jgi:polyisoprenoid-binding protein YceI